MTKPISILLVSLAAATCQVACAIDLASNWTLEVRDLQKQQQVLAKVRFSDKSASSCMAGTWKTLVVVAVLKQSGDSFPITSPLAYTIQEGTLTLGRTQVCDGYLFLSGAEHPHHVSGDYRSVSIGSSVQIGTFTLQRSK